MYLKHPTYCCGGGMLHGGLLGKSESLTTSLVSMETTPAGFVSIHVYIPLSLLVTLPISRTQSSPNVIYTKNYSMYIYSTEFYFGLIIGNCFLKKKTRHVYRVFHYISILAFHKSERKATLCRPSLLIVFPFVSHTTLGAGEPVILHRNIALPPDFTSTM